MNAEPPAIASLRRVAEEIHAASKEVSDMADIMDLVLWEPEAEAELTALSQRMAAWAALLDRAATEFGL